MSEEATREAEYLRWVEDESRRREVAELKAAISGLLTLQLLAALLSGFWVVALFIGYKRYPDLIPAELAGIVTATTLFGGAMIFWQLRRLLRQREARLALLERSRPPTTDPSLDP